MISVYITTQNRPHFLSRALNSLVEQTYKNFEVIICNDCSDSKYDEDYHEVISFYRDKFLNLVYLKNEKVLGACLSRNNAIKVSQGQYITGLDDDDVFHSRRLELFMKLKDQSEFSFICSNVKLYHDGLDLAEELKSGGVQITFEDMKKSNLVGNQIFIKKDILVDCGCFDPKMSAWQDYDTWFRVIHKFGKAYKLNACTMYLDNDLSRERITTSSKAYQGYQSFIRKHAEHLSEEDLICLKYTDLINRKKSFPLFSCDFLKIKKMWPKLIKGQMPYRFPRLYTYYQSRFK